MEVVAIDDGGRGNHDSGCSGDDDDGSDNHVMMMMG